MQMDIISANSTIPSIGSVVPTATRNEAAGDPQIEQAKQGTKTALNGEDKPLDSKSQLKDATERVREFVETVNRNLDFSIDESTNQLVVKVIDVGTKEVIRQIPSEEMLAIAAALDKVQGLFVQNKV